MSFSRLSDDLARGCSNLQRSKSSSERETP